MKLLTKTLSLFLCLLLVGQSVAFASDTQPQTLAQYQQRAKEELHQNSWLKKDGLYLLGITGTAAGLIIFYQRAIKALKTEKTALESQISIQSDMITTLKRYQGKSLPKVQANRLRSAQNARDILRKKLVNANLRIRTMERKEGMYSAMLNLPTADLSKYLALFERNLSTQHRKELLTSLSKEPWVKALAEQERTEFLAFIQQVGDILSQSKYVNNNTSIWMLIGQTTVATKKGYVPLLKNFAYHLMHSKNLLPISIIFVLGWASTTDVQAQKRAARIDSNFNLFLNATPQKLAEMQRDPIQRQVCIQGAEALHILSQMSQQEVQNMVKEIKQSSRQPVVHPRTQAR